MRERKRKADWQNKRERERERERGRASQLVFIYISSIVINYHRQNQWKEKAYISKFRRFVLNLKKIKWKSILFLSFKLKVLQNLDLWILRNLIYWGEKQENLTGLPAIFLREYLMVFSRAAVSFPHFFRTFCVSYRPSIRVEVNNLSFKRKMIFFSLKKKNCPWYALFI